MAHAPLGLLPEIWQHEVLPRIAWHGLMRLRRVCRWFAPHVLPHLYAAEGGHACSEDQLQAIHALVTARDSLFLTGAAGTGKSHVLRAALAALRRLMGARGFGQQVMVAAMTGVAALLLPGGCTLHSAAHIGIKADVSVARAIKTMGEECTARVPPLCSRSRQWRRYGRALAC